MTSFEVKGEGGGVGIGAEKVLYYRIETMNPGEREGHLIFII